MANYECIQFLYKPTEILCDPPSSVLILPPLFSYVQPEIRALEEGISIG